LGKTLLSILFQDRANSNPNLSLIINMQSIVDSLKSRIVNLENVIAGYSDSGHKADNNENDNENDDDDDDDDIDAENSLYWPVNLIRKKKTDDDPKWDKAIVSDNSKNWMLDMEKEIGDLLADSLKNANNTIAKQGSKIDKLQKEVAALVSNLNFLTPSLFPFLII
jgi:hypothetical protein